MATDKLMNHTQGESIITNLSSIASNLQNVTAISPAKFGMGYAVCDTAAATAAKTATIANYTLTEGALVTVKFTNGSTSTGATLNLNDTGAKNILYKGQALTSNIISAGDICTFIYSTNAYNIINLDALSGAGAGTVRSIGAEGGLITDQTSGAAIQQEGNVKLNLKSQSTIVAVGAPDTETTKTYPVALDSSGYPGVAVPWTDTTYSTFTDSVDGLVPAADGTGETGMFLKGDGTWATPTNTTYSQGSGINIDANNEISNTGVTAISPSSNNGNISVTTNGSTADVAVTGLNNAAYKDVDSTIDMSDPSSNVPTSAAVSTAITNAVNALPEPMVFKGTVNGTYPATPNVGDTYKATANSTSGVTPAYKMGDTVIYSEPSTGTFEWVVIPSGDEPSGTVTGITGSDGIVTLDATTSSSTISTSGTAKLALVTNHTTSVNAGNATSTANRSYPVAIDGNSKLAVNVPWENTTYANGTGITIGSGNAINHSNSVTEVTTAGAYKVKYDAQGHITGTAALSASDISAVPTSRTVNSKALTGNITLSGDDLVLTNYVKGSSTDAVAATDKVNAAIAKHENRLDTCQTNILYTLGKTGKNVFDFDSWIDGLTVTRGTFTTSGNSITITATENDASTDRWNPASNVGNTFKIPTKAGEVKILQWSADLSQASNGGTVYIFPNGSPTGLVWGYASSSKITYTVPSGCEFITIRFGVARSGESITFSNIMICAQEDWNVSPDYQPYKGLPNVDLTQLEAEDRNALVEVVDSGAKNLVDLTNLEAIKALNTSSSGSWTNNVYTYDTVSFTINNDCTISVSTNGQSTTQAAIYLPVPVLQDYESYVVSGCPVGGSQSQTNAYLLDYQYQRDGNIAYLLDIGGGVNFVNRASDSDRRMLIIVRAQTTISTPIIFKPMICTEAEWNMSHAFVPYCRSNSDLTEREATDREALAEVVDSGAKNKFNLDSTLTASNCSFAKTSDAITITASDHYASVNTVLTLKAGTYILRTKPSNATVGSAGQVAIGYGLASSVSLIENKSWNGIDEYLELKLTVTTEANYRIYLYANLSSTSPSSNVVTFSEIMFCTKAAFDISPAFVPYRPDYDDIVEQMPHITKIAATTTDTEALISSATISIPASTLIRITARLNYNATAPKSITLSFSDDPDLYKTPRYLIATEERSTGELWLDTQVCRAVSGGNQAASVYVWASSMASGSNKIIIVTELLGNL